MKEKRVVNSPSLPLAQPNYTSKPLRKFPTLIFVRSTHFLHAIEFVFRRSTHGRIAFFLRDTCVILGKQPSASANSRKAARYVRNVPPPKKNLSNEVPALFCIIFNGCQYFFLPFFVKIFSTVQVEIFSENYS